ncbi:serine/threonine-protein kinase [Pseudonocardia eucalypti]|uniref:non-specific serine/threonine protein kinase n=1 Tax=Pseudonocardia eucalypti TaxID=648755 RepID=A0ABP9PH27_9PSEU|nr:serine/threonine-protein kinase [Pseudonocardia eucalypti]
MAMHSGDRVVDRYQLLKRIAVGGMGEVWEAHDERLGRTVAIKVLKPEIGSDPEFLERFRGEARIAASLNHRGIAGVHDYGEDVLPDGTPTAFIVMELVRGEPLSTRLATRGKLEPAAALDIMEQCAKALQAAHAHGFVHRDVKPGNILISEDGTVKITDFGIAKAASAAPVTASGMVMGTAHYIAPEQARGEDASPASDVYSLAVVGYECVAGHRPFAAEQPVDVAMMHINDPVPPLPESVPPPLRRLLDLTLVKEPGERYANGGEFAVAVAAVRRGGQPPLPGSGWGSPSWGGSGSWSAVGATTGSRKAIGQATAGVPTTALAPSAIPTQAIAPRPVSASQGMSADQPTSMVPAAQPRPPLPGRQMPPPPVNRLAGLPAPRRAGRTVLTLGFVLLTLAAITVGVLVVRNAVAQDSGVQPQSPTVQATEPTAQTGAAPGAPGAPEDVDEPDDPDEPAAPADPPGTVRVELAGYAGKPATVVQSELQNNGLRVQMRTVAGQAPRAPANCTVTDVRPAGPVPKGTAVTITCAQH